MFMIFEHSFSLNIGRTKKSAGYYRISFIGTWKIGVVFEPIQRQMQRHKQPPSDGGGRWDSAAKDIRDARAAGVPLPSTLPGLLDYPGLEVLYEGDAA